MKKMGKKVLGTIAMGAATVATGMAANVHADNVTVTKQQVGDETKITTTTTKDVNQQKVSQDEQAISNQQKIVDNAKSTLDSAKANSNSSSQAVSSAQSNVDNTKKALDNAKGQVSKVSGSKIKQQIQQDQNQVAQDKQSINTTQSSIQQDQTNINNDQQSIANADQKVQQDQQKLNADQGKLVNAQNNVQQSQQVIANNQTKVNAINDILNDTANVQVPDNLKNGSKINDDTVPGFYKWINSQLPMHTSDDNEKVDLNHLTPDQLKKINIFAVNVINEVSKQVGGGNHILNQNMIDMANEVVSLVNKTNFDVYDNGHDDYAINQAAKDHGLQYNSQYLNPDVKSYPNQGINGNWYEDWSGMYSNPIWVNPNDTTAITYPNPDYSKYTGTMYGLKISVLESLLALMGDTDHFNGTFMGNNVYTGIGVNNTDGPERAGIHVETVDADSNDIVNNSLFSGKDIDINHSALQEKLNSLKNEISKQNEKINEENKVIKSLQNQIEKDKEQIIKDSPSSLQKQLNKDQQKLANDQNTLKQQQDKLAKDEAQLKNDQNKLNSITPTEVAKAQQQLEEAQSNYNDAVKKLNEAQNKANASKDEVAKAQQNYLDALNKLNELKQVLEDDKKEITTISVEWIKNEHPVTTANMGNKVVLSSSKGSARTSSESTVKATISNKTTLTSESSAYVATTVKPAKDSLIKETQSTNSIHFTSEAPVQFSTKNPKGNTNKAALPQMGDENSKSTLWGEISLAVAGILASFGLAERKRSK